MKKMPIKNCYSVSAQTKSIDSVSQSALDTVKITNKQKTSNILVDRERELRYQIHNLKQMCLARLRKC